jgi:hypothetical protein
MPNEVNLKAAETRKVRLQVSVGHARQNTRRDEVQTRDMLLLIHETQVHKKSQLESTVHGAYGQRKY